MDNFKTATLSAQPPVRYDYEAFDFIHKLTGIEKAMLLAGEWNWFSDEEILKILTSCADYVIYSDTNMRQYYDQCITANTDDLDKAQMFVLNAYGTIFKTNVNVTTPGSILYDICQKYVFVTSERTSTRVAETAGVFKDTILSYAMCRSFIPVERELAIRDDISVDDLVAIFANHSNICVSGKLTEIISHSALDVTINILRNTETTLNLYMKADSEEFKNISNSIIGFGVHPDANLQSIRIAADYFKLSVDEYLTKYFGSLIIRYLDAMYHFGFIKEGDDCSKHINNVMTKFDNVTKFYGYDISKLSFGVFRFVKKEDEKVTLSPENYIPNKYTYIKDLSLHMGVVYKKGESPLYYHIQDVISKS